MQRDGLRHQIGVAAARHQVTEDPSLELVSGTKRAMYQYVFRIPFGEFFRPSERGIFGTNEPAHPYHCIYIQVLTVYRSRQRLLAATEGCCGELNDSSSLARLRLQSGHLAENPIAVVNRAKFCW